jgi:hypothetical protein
MILNKALGAIKGLLHIPGVVKSLSTLGNKIFILFIEHHQFQWKLATSLNVTGHVIHEAATDSVTCPFQELPCMGSQNEYSNRWRLASFDGSTVCNLTPNRFLNYLIL